MNLVIISGRLGQNAEVKTFESGNIVCRLNVATTEKWKEGDEWKSKTTWHVVNVWGYKAERAKYYKKGDLVTVRGKIDQRKYVDKEGIERYLTEIVAEQITDNIKLGGEGLNTIDETQNPYNAITNQHQTTQTSEAAPPAQRPWDPDKDDAFSLPGSPF